MARRRKQASLASVAATALIALAAWGFNAWQNGQAPAPAQKTTTTVAAGADQTTYKKLAAMDYANDSDPVIEVGGDASGLDLAKWQGPRIQYGNLDSLNRTTTNVGYLDARTLIKSAGRPGQTFEPTGWHNRYTWVDGRRVNRQNRGHLIAYTLSGNLDSDGNYKQGELGSSDNPKNLASQTEFANQVLMQPFEQQVRDALAKRQRVIYKVTTVFRGSELMPRGYWLRAKAASGLDFNVYVFNVQNEIRYDYATGRSTVDRSVSVPDKDQ
ncbi:DNA/RNA non-specific endonuclease [Lacticaseibacillus kribbianus]|uniref:DNA/RNA non-specific endonuclease n=1 Tax=Lacticaseibacillus kribbianus TaxID=2926292 RepID=UPI001CD7D146|nr:DNA/RNA non-specific endonuclease [Lacticaseibacillus kribbianus]